MGKSEYRIQVVCEIGWGNVLACSIIEGIADEKGGLAEEGLAGQKGLEFCHFKLRLFSYDCFTRWRGVDWSLLDIGGSNDRNNVCDVKGLICNCAWRTVNFCGICIWPHYRSNFKAEQ